MAFHHLEKYPVLYMYQLLDDYKEGNLYILSDSMIHLQQKGNWEKLQTAR